MPLPCSPTPFQADRALHNQLCPALRNPRSFHPSQHSHPPQVAEPDPAPGMAPGRTGQGSGHGINAGGHMLPAQPWLGPRGAALAGLGGSTAGRVAPGLRCCGSCIPASRRLALLPYLTITALLACSSGLSPWGCKRLGVAVPLPWAASCRSKGWARVSSPSFPGRVEIIPTEPFPSSLGISRQVCDSP